MGKSALVANIAENVAVDHRPVALFSLEMSVTELAQRFIASRARIPGDKLRKGQVARSDWPKVVKACESSTTRRSGSTTPPTSTSSSCAPRRGGCTRSEQQRGGLGLIIVDYLQLMRADPSADSRVQQVGLMSRGLKILARELEVPVVAVSQLSRAPEQRSDTHKRPILSDLRESGQIEQDADLVMFIYREEYYNRETERQGIADIIVAKHRNGPIGDVEMTFLSRYPKFANIARAERPADQVPVGTASGMSGALVRGEREWDCPHAVETASCSTSRETRSPVNAARPGCDGHARPGVSSVIPRKYRGVSFDRAPVTELSPNVVRPCARSAANIDENIRHGRGLWFMGDVGTGKTTLAMLVSKEAIKRGHSVAIYSVPRLLAEIRDTYDTGPESDLTPTCSRSSWRSTCCTSTTSAPRSRPNGCSSSSIRSSTSDTSRSARSW